MDILIQTLSEDTHIEYTDGVHLAEYNESGACFLPVNNWKKGHNFHKNSALNPFDRAVTLIDIDPYIRELFWSKIAPIFLDKETEFKKNAFANYVADIIKRLKKFSNIETKELITHQLVINPPGIQTTAYNHEKNFRIGLHIDTHNTPQLNNRKNGFHLLGINLGKSHRYFNFALYTVENILNLLKKNYKNFSQVRELKDEFLKKFPETKIFRFKINPDQAYIAVSQNVIHDGATNEDNTPDITLLLAGYFLYKKD